MVIKRITKKVRCEMRGCKQRAVAGIGPKGADFFLCKRHLEEVRDGAIIILRDIQKEMLAEQRKATKAAQLNAAAEEALEATEAAVTKGIEIATVQAEEVKEEIKEEVFHCKWCGQDIPRKTMTTNEFARHCRDCKKEHNGVPFSE